VRSPCTPHPYRAAGQPRAHLDWEVHTGAIVRVAPRVYANGPEPPSRLEAAVGTVFGTDRVARGLVAAAIHEFDGLDLAAPPLRRTRAPMLAGPPVHKHGVLCANGLQ